MPAEKPRDVENGARFTLRRATSQVVLPSSRTWTVAVHEAGHCVMAYLLDLCIIRAVIRPENNTGSVWWRHAWGRYVRFRDEPCSRAAVEADALVALAGAAAQWLYKAGSVRAVDMEHDDKLATTALNQIEGDDTVVSNWLEYLRQRALRMLAAQQYQALIARLAGLFVEKERLLGSEIYSFLDQEGTRVTKFLSDDNDTTIEDYVGLIGTALFAQSIESLALGTRPTSCLRAARITTLGRLLQHSAYDLSPIKGLGKTAVLKIVEAVSRAGFELARLPRSNWREVHFSARAIYERDTEFALRAQRSR